MNKKLILTIVATSLMGLVTGAFIGAFATKKKAEAQANKDIESVKNEFKKMISTADSASSCETPEVQDVVVEQPEKTDRHICDMYVIPPKEFGEIEGYEKIDLTYTADGALLDDSDEPIENSEEIVGTEYMNHFGEYEDDAVYIRNDVRRCDYAILKEYRAYSETIHRLNYSED